MAAVTRAAIPAMCAARCFRGSADPPMTASVEALIGSAATIRALVRVAGG